jgi:two-component system response regulator TctD
VLVAVALSRAELGRALDAGADIALAGDPRPVELAARLRALERRAHAPLTVGPLVLHPAARACTLDGTPLALPRREFALLCCLACAPGRLFSKDELRRHLYGAGPATSASRALERTMARLRRRLGPHGAMLVTVWGAGYRLDPPV